MQNNGMRHSQDSIQYKAKASTVWSIETAPRVPLSCRACIFHAMDFAGQIKGTSQTLAAFTVWYLVYAMFV